MTTRSKVGIFKTKVYYGHLSTVPSPPATVKVVVASSQWFQAKYFALLKNHTWSLTTLPKGASLVDCKGIFKTKLNVDGSFQRCKARLVAKGFNQTEGFDYIETFSPVVKHTTIRVILAHVVTSNYHKANRYQQCIPHRLKNKNTCRNHLVFSLVIQHTCVNFRKQLTT